ncbi:MAG: AraC family transcriptional regulator [Phycisphaeraceae bacterium]|nr:AraC family transcriptional regulator [Phycisphaeraceae bacterium]
MKIHIKNMVCQRCIMAVREVFENAGHQLTDISLGQVEVTGEVGAQELVLIKGKLQDLGFEIIDDSKSRIIEKIKNIIIELIHYPKGPQKMNYSMIIQDELNKDYNYLSSLFSSVEGMTIEKYIIHQKIEKVKELLVYGELTLSEIAYKMGYSSVAHLSNQFKKTTGLTPTYFREIGHSKRKPLDQVD